MSSLLTKCVAIALALCMLVGIGCSAEVNAATEPSKKPQSLLEGIGEVVSGGYITVNGIKNALYKEFADPDEAIADLYHQIPSYLATLANEYNLERLSSSNWTKYQESMYKLAESTTGLTEYTETSQDFRTLRAFFDMYENSTKNEEIVKLYTTISSERSSNYAELILLLPYTAPIVREYATKNTYRTGEAHISVEDAISYATQYATAPNTPTYYYFSNGDCANFASQILEQAGLTQDASTSEYSGWWHTRTSGFLGFGYTHKHSRSWTMADTFSKYMGIVFTTTSHLAFSENIEPGSIISADFDSDGDWDHVGFVTDKNLTIGSCGYYDYRVAQHSTNYHDWASTDTNGWDTIEADGGTYARVMN